MSGGWNEQVSLATAGQKVDGDPTRERGSQRASCRRAAGLGGGEDRHFCQPLELVEGGN
jgi:hypothetical protein